MIKLRELLDKYEGVYIDKEIIVEYFVQNNMEYEGMNLLISLARNKAQKVQDELDYIKSWMPNKVDMTKVHSCKEVGENLNQIITYQICGFELPNELLEWAKENIPNMELPQLMFRDTIKWLKEKYGIEFKDSRKYKYWLEG